MDPETKTPSVFISILKSKAVKRIAMLLLFLLGAYLVQKQMTATDDTKPVTTSFEDYTEVETTDTGIGPVALVNGEEINRTDYNNQSRELLTMALRSGLDTTNPTIASQLRSQALDVLVNLKLLEQAARRDGLFVPADDVGEAYYAIKEENGGSEIFAKILEDRNLTDAEFRQNLENELLIDLYIEQNTNLDEVTITDEEVQEYFETIDRNTEENLFLDDMEAELRTRLRQFKQQEQVGELIAKEKTDAVIEKLI